MGLRDGVPWLWDEYLIVGDFWQRRGRTAGVRDPEVQRIAQLLGRSPGSITHRVGNFAGTDRPGTGLKQITGEPLEKWTKIRGNREAVALAVADAQARLALLTGESGTIHHGATARVVPPERPGTEPVAVVTREAARYADQAEAVLRERFRVWRDPKGHRLHGIEITTPKSILRVDLFDPAANILIEVKAKAERDYLRFAIGQLYDYRRYLDFVVDLAILVPDEPDEDLMELLRVARIAAIWPSGDSFADSEGGRLLLS